MSLSDPGKEHPPIQVKSRLDRWLGLCIIALAGVRTAYALMIGVGELPDSSRYFGSIGAFGGWSVVPTFLYTIFPDPVNVALQVILISALWAWATWVLVCIGHVRWQKVGTVVIVFTASSLPNVLQWDWFKMADGLILGSGALMLAGIAVSYHAIYETERSLPWAALLTSFVMMSMARPSTLLFSFPLLLVALTPPVWMKRRRDTWSNVRHLLALGAVVVIAALLSYDAANYWKPFQANNRLMFRGSPAYLDLALHEGMPSCSSLDERFAGPATYNERSRNFDFLPIEQCPPELDTWFGQGGVSPVSEAIGLPRQLLGSWASALYEIQWFPLVLRSADGVREDNELGLRRNVPDWPGNSGSRGWVETGIIIFQGSVLATGFVLLSIGNRRGPRRWGFAFLLTTQGPLWLYMFTSYWVDPMEIQRHALPASALIPLSFWFASQVASSGHQPAAVSVAHDS